MRRLRSDWAARARSARRYAGYAAGDGKHDAEVQAGRAPAKPEQAERDLEAWLATPAKSADEEIQERAKERRTKP